MALEARELRERDIVELLPDTPLPFGYRVPAGARGRVVIIDEDSDSWVTVQFGRYRRPVCVPRRQVRRVER
ncbi:MAG TPA: hypothetical protein VII06_19235 [Chloroflexota bacterium]|jgi:hypothetical protein